MSPITMITPPPTRKRATRYVIRPTNPSAASLAPQPRIVMAPTSAAAIAHVAASLLVASPITLDEMEELASQGIRTEYPGRDEEEGQEAAPAQPAVDPATQAMLAEIANAPADDLPPMVTKMAQNDDGTPQRDAAGNVILLNQDGTPLTIIQRAIVARHAQLRAQAGG